MVANYPISVPRKMYKGADVKKREKAQERNRIADELESYLNKLIEKQTQERASYFYFQIANETGHAEKTVREILFSVDCGHTGLTVYKPQKVG